MLFFFVFTIIGLQKEKKKKFFKKIKYCEFWNVGKKSQI